MPFSFTSGQVLTAAEMNALVQSSYATGAGGLTSSTSYVAVGGSPAISSFAVNTRVRIDFGSLLQNDTVDQATYAAIAISGPTNVAANDTTGIFYLAPIANYSGQFGRTIEVGGLTPGNYTFTMEYRVTGGDGTFSACSLGVQRLD